MENADCATEWTDEHCIFRGQGDRAFSAQAIPSTPTTLVLLLTLATATLLRRKRGQSPFS
jgi:hypothetical protein